jgi:Flp pilus assembly protein TadG
MTAIDRTRRRSRGQALVETALVLPIFLGLLMGVVDMGRAVWATTSLNSAAREAARYAIVHGGSASNTCPVGNPAPDAVPPPAATASCPYYSPSRQSIFDAAKAAAIAGGSNVVVKVCYGVNCVPTTDVIGLSGSDTSNNARNQPITVVVSSTVNLVVPSLLGMSTFNLSGSSTMVVNH